MQATQPPRKSRAAHSRSLHSTVEGAHRARSGILSKELRVRNLSSQCKPVGRSRKGKSRMNTFENVSRSTMDSMKIDARMTR